MDYNFYGYENELNAYFQSGDGAEGGEEEGNGIDQGNALNLYGEVNENVEGEGNKNEEGEEDLEKEEEEEQKNFKKNARMANCPTIIQPPFDCPDCGKHSLYMEPVASLIVRDGILAIGACIGVEVPPEYFSPFFCCVNKKCKEYYKNTGTRFYLNKETKKLIKIKNYFHISR